VTAEEDVLGRIIEMLRAADIPYMVTGSIAASYHGRPRATHDADVVIDPSPEQFDQLLAALERADFHLSADTARDALRHRRPFNVIEIARAVKIDLIVRKARPFSVEEFGRRQPVDFPFASGVSTVTAEDAILSKLDWARQGGDSERQLRDAAGIVELNPGLDWDYIRRWASQLGVSALWERIAPEHES
jgi:hypothetical protein